MSMSLHLGAMGSVPRPVLLKNEDCDSYCNPSLAIAL